MGSPPVVGGLAQSGTAADADEIRRMLARELHDQVAQTLTTMLIELENFKVEQMGRKSVLRQLDGLQDSTRDVLTSLRRVLYDLRGESGIEEGFAEAVRALLANFEQRTHVKAHLSVSPWWPSPLRSQAALNIYRIIEEALTNVRQHSGAGLVEVALGAGAGSSYVAVEVKDDGRGSESGAGGRAPGMGVLGMQERAVILGGRLEVVTTAGGGTTVRAILPKEQLI
ncbi:MAG TPA: sensor histidine kinase [Candidatus Dormibacteraeota bacterium]|nr:sensor histidine kinase [Candidatus Dormibacteraeota bacterium]